MNKASTNNTYRRMPFQLFRTLHKHYIIYIFIYMHIYVDAVKIAQKKAHPNDPMVASGEGTGRPACLWEAARASKGISLCCSLMLYATCTHITCIDIHMKETHATTKCREEALNHARSRRGGPNYHRRSEEPGKEVVSVPQCRCP